MDKTETNYVVGQELAFNVGYGSRTWQIFKITKITPSGRVVCGQWTLNCDLRVRGRGEAFGGPYHGYLVTDKIRNEYDHQILVSYFTNLKFRKLDLQTLRTMKAWAELKE